MQQRTFKEEILYQWNYGGMHIRLIGVNLAVFVFIGTILMLGRLFFGQNAYIITNIIESIFMLRGDFTGLLFRPWGLFTSIFAHFDFMHFLFNMVFLYFASQLFLRYFSSSRLLYTYILGGVLGGLFQIIAYSIFPELKNTLTYVVGASGSVMAIFMAAAFYRPMEEIFLFGLLRIKMIYIAGIFILLDVLRLGATDNIAHFAHLGGIVFGIWSIRNLHSSNNVVTWFQRTVDNLIKSWKKEPKLKARKGGKTSHFNTKNDDEFMSDKKAKQEQIDKILDKISKSGYDSLSKKEKQILFDQSNNG